MKPKKPPPPPRLLLAPAQTLEHRVAIISTRLYIANQQPGHTSEVTSHSKIGDSQQRDRHLDSKREPQRTCAWTAPRTHVLRPPSRRLRQPRTNTKLTEPCRMRSARCATTSLSLARTLRGCRAATNTISIASGPGSSGPAHVPDAASPSPRILLALAELLANCYQSPSSPSP